MLPLFLESTGNLELLVGNLIDKGVNLGWTITKALFVFFAGRFFISILRKVLERFLEKRKIDSSVLTFTASLVNIILTFLLIISIVGIFGIPTASFAALIASAGVTIGVALSGNLSNFAGGVIILVFKPFRVGNYIEAQNFGGTVKEIQIFHTILTTSDNKMIFVPNGSLSSGIVTNYNKLNTRRVEWVFGVEYGTNYEKARDTLMQIIENHELILHKPAPFIALKALDAHSVNIVVRVWVRRENYWGVFFDINKQVYETFNKEGIVFPFPQLTIHQAQPEESN